VDSVDLDSWKGSSLAQTARKIYCQLPCRARATTQGDRALLGTCSKIKTMPESSADRAGEVL